MERRGGSGKGTNVTPTATGARVGVSQQSSDGSVPVIGPEQSVAEALALLRASPEGRVGVRGDSGNVEAELYLSDPALRDELLGAKEVQQRLLPRVVPTVPGFDFAGRYASAGLVGGDYWSVKYYREEDVVTCKLADVSGHGVGAAILMAAVKFVSGVLFRHSPSPAAVMERTNHSLLRETSPDKMATMIYAWAYPKTGQVRLVNAGHSPAFVCRASGEITDIAPTGPLLGLIETKYDEIKLTLSPGDMLFFCSDGVAEAGKPDSLGEARIKEIVAEHRAERADAIAEAVFQAARSSCDEQPHDDMSLLIIKAAPAPARTTAPVPASLYPDEPA